MKQVFKADVFVGALLGFGLGAQSHAATDSKKTQALAKKADSSANAGKTTKSVAAKAPGKSASRSTAQKSPVKHASASGGGSKKSLRKVSMADVDPTHLALYSASALVIDQEDRKSVV